MSDDLKNVLGDPDGAPAAAYVRTVTIDVEEQVTRQLDAIHKIAESAHLRIGMSDIYADLGVRGESVDRPGFSRMLASLEQSGVTAVVVTSPDRISRSSQSNHAIGQITVLGVRVVYQDDKGIRIIDPAPKRSADADAATLADTDRVIANAFEAVMVIRALRQARAETGRQYKNRAKKGLKNARL